MKFLLWCCPFFLFLISFVQTIRAASAERALTPPRGWNSYDSFTWTFDEATFMVNAENVASRLKPYGYEYVVVDYLWYRERKKGASTTAAGFDLIDQWGRPVPDPLRWPSSKNGNGFSQVANSVHGLGLKFGIHVMRGLSLVAYNANTPILDITTGLPYQEGGRNWTTKDIGVEERACSWMQQGFMSVNTDLGAGKAFLKSLYHQYNHWGVDFVKHDCVFGDDLDIKEISTVSEILGGFGRSLVYSLSPGTSVTPQMAEEVAGLVNMYRVSADSWDTWHDVATHFNVARDFAAANKIGGSGLHGKSWPDLDMLALGALSEPGPFRNCRLTPDEQRTMVTLWAMAKSPLMFGGDMRNVKDDFTFNLITNPTVLEINSFSSKNKEISELQNGTLMNAYSGLCATGNVVRAEVPSDVRIWIAAGSPGEIYVAFFNLTPQDKLIYATIPAFIKEVHDGAPTKASCKVTEVWSGKDFGVVTEKLSMWVPTHGTALFVLNC